MELIALRPTRESDLDFVLALERDPENAPFISQWSRDEHRETIARPDREHWILERPGSEQRLGYLIAYDLGDVHCGVYVKRIVSAAKSGGVGRAALGRFASHAFDDLRAPYVWLAVRQANLRGQRCYRAVGFVDFAADPGEIARHDLAAERSTQGSLRMILHAREASDVG